MSLLRVDDICAYLDSIAPFRTAADWDNVGLLVGDGSRTVTRVMTCLTITEDVVEEAIENGVDVIITHHPLMHKAIRRLTNTHPDGKILLELCESKISVICAHTAYDNASGGINELIAQGIGLQSIVGLRPVLDLRQTFQGEGRFGVRKQPIKLDALVASLKTILNADHVHVSAPSTHTVERAAIACGAGGSLLVDAVRQRADVFITGEIRFHDILFAQSHNVAVIAAGHFATERFAMEHLAKLLQDLWSDLNVWASQRERNPLRLL